MASPCSISLCLLTGLLLSGLLTLGFGAGTPHTVVMIMMARDEEVNLRANLGLWDTLIDYYVLGIDDRTRDGTLEAITSTLPPHKPHSIFNFTFNGFGQARTLLFQEAWRSFPQATHLLIADPDWIPVVPSINKGDLDLDHDYFQFLIWDRNNITTRQSDWLMRHREGIHMIYRLHEVLVYPVKETKTKELTWEVYEVERPRGWHETAGHSHSQSYHRYLFDLDLLTKDLEEEGNKPSDHTLYYLGLTHFALIEAKLPLLTTEKEREAFNQGEAQLRIQHGLQYLTERLRLHLNSPSWEQTWACMRWLAYAYQLFLNDFENAEHWYKKCSEFDPERVDCPIFLARLYLEWGKPQLAWPMAERSLLTSYPVRAFGNNFYIYECFTAVESSKVILSVLKQPSEPLNRSLFVLGWRLIDFAEMKCDRGFLVEPDNILEALREGYGELATLRGSTVAELSSCLPRDEPNDKVLWILQDRLSSQAPPSCPMASSTSTSSSFTTSKTTHHTASSASASFSSSATHTSSSSTTTRTTTTSSSWSTCSNLTSSTPTNTKVEEILRTTPFAGYPAKPVVGGPGTASLGSSPATATIDGGTRNQLMAPAGQRQDQDHAIDCPADGSTSKDRERPVEKLPTNGIPRSSSSTVSSSSGRGSGSLAEVAFDRVGPPWAITPQVLDSFLFQGKRDWSKPFLALMWGHEEAGQVLSLARGLEALGCPYHLTYAHEVPEFLQQARASLSPVLKSRISFTPILEGSLALPTTHHPYDYISISHILNVSPVPPQDMLQYLGGLLAKEGGMSIEAFSSNSFLDAVQHFRSLLLSSRSNSTTDQATIRQCLARFAHRTMQSHADLVEGGIIPDEGLYRVASRLMRSFRVSEMGQVVESAGLSVVNILGALFYDPALFLDDDELLLTITETMRSWDRFSMGEYFVPRSRHRLFAIKSTSLPQPHLGELAFARPKLFQVIPIPLNASAIADMAQHIHHDDSHTLRYQIPLSTEVYEWPADPDWAKILQAIDGRKSVLKIFEETKRDMTVKMSFATPTSQLATFLDSFHHLYSVLNGLGLMVLRDSKGSR